MRVSIALVVLCISIASSAYAQRPDVEPLPATPADLVELLAEGDIEHEFRSRGGPRSTGARAAAALIQMKDEAVPELAKVLNADSVKIRNHAAFALARIGTPATVQPLITAAGDNDSNVRATAVSGLPAYTNPEARKALIRALNDEDSDVRIAAVRAFRPRYGEQRPDNAIAFATANVLLPLLEGPETQFATAEVLGDLGSNVASRPLVKLFQAEDKRVRWAAVEALGKLKDKQVTIDLAAMLTDDDAYVQMYAANSLGQIGDLRATPYLVGALSAEEYFVRRDSAYALGKIGDRRAVEALVAILDDTESHVSAAAAEALGRIGDPRSVPALITCLDDADPRLAQVIAEALGNLGDPRAVDPLAQSMLTSEPAEKSRAPIDALAKIRHPAAIAALVKVTLNVEDNLLRHQSRSVLGDLVGRPFRFESDETVKAWWRENRAEYERSVDD